MSPSIMAEIRPHLTLYGPAQPDPQAADPVVAAALALVSPAIGSPSSLPVGAAAPVPPLLTVRIAAAAHGPGGALATMVVIARVGAMLPTSYVVLSRKARLG
jgi:general secretion pathway protein K